MLNPLTLPRVTRDVAESTTDMIFVLDRDWSCLPLNQAATYFFLSSATRLTNRPNGLWLAFPQWQGSIFEQELRQAMCERRDLHFEAFSAVGKRWLETTVHPHNAGLLVCLRDISERKQIEADVLARSRLANLISRVSRFMVFSHQLSDCLQYCADAMVEELDGAIAAVWLYNPQTELLERQCMSVNPHFSDPLFETHVRQLQAVPLTSCFVGVIGQSHESVVNSPCPRLMENGQETVIHPRTGQVVSVDPERLFCCFPRAEAEPLPSLLYLCGYPLVLDGQLIGVLGIWTEHPFPQCIQEGLENLADSLALDIDRSSAQSSFNSRREALLFRLANQIRNSLDLDTILGTAVQEIRAMLDVDYCGYLWSWSEAGNMSVMVSHEAVPQGDTAPTLGQYLSPELNQLLVEQIATQEILRLDQLPAHLLQGQTALAELLQNLQARSLLLLPLQTRASHKGAIICLCRQVVQHWSDPDVELLQAVVDQLSLAIDQAELFAQTRAAALAAQTQAQQLERALQELKRTQAQLIQTEKMSSLGQMIAGIAHEINNPVNFISGNLNYAGDYVNDLLRLITAYQERLPEPDPDLEELLDEVDLEFLLADLPKTLASMQIGAERIRQIVLSLRNFSRLDQAEMKPVDIHEGIDSTLLILHNRLKAKGERPEIQVVKNYAELPLIECYAGQLNQVFMNILANGIEAFEGQPEPWQITVTTTLLSAAGTPIAYDEDRFAEDGLAQRSVVQIAIADNGMGMSPSTVNSIFDPFFTTKPVGKGTGLGLAISYQIIVEKHRGTIVCESTPGEGTTFKITIPCVQSLPNLNHNGHGGGAGEN